MNADVGRLASNWLAKAEDFYLPTPDEAEETARIALAAREFVRARLRQAGLDHPTR